MNQYEVTFIVDPVLTDSEIKATSDNYVDHLKNEGGAIVHVDEMGLKQLAYPIKKRNSGFYYCLEFQHENGSIIQKLELALRRDERIMRFLTVHLDKFGIKYNEDKRNGLIKPVAKKEKVEKKDNKGRDRDRDRRSNRSERDRSAAGQSEAPVKKEAPAKVEAPVKAPEPAKAAAAATAPKASTEEE